MSAYSDSVCPCARFVLVGLPVKAYYNNIGSFNDRRNLLYSQYNNYISARAPFDRSNFVPLCSMYASFKQP